MITCIIHEFLRICNTYYLMQSVISLALVCLPASTSTDHRHVTDLGAMKGPFHAHLCQSICCASFPHFARYVLYFLIFLLYFRLIYFSPYLVLRLFQSGLSTIITDWWICMHKYSVSWNAQVEQIVMCGTLAKTRDFCHDIIVTKNLAFGSTISSVF